MRFDQTGEAAVRELLDREAIRDVLYRYCRAIDRCDAELLTGVYWPGAIDNHGMWSGTVEEFVPFVIPVLLSRDATSHRISNVLIRIEGDEAKVESYFDAYERPVRNDGTPNDITMIGRYLDSFERRDGEWRIAGRTVITDAFRVWSDSADWERGLYGKTFEMGHRGEVDASAALLGDIS